MKEAYPGEIGDWWDEGEEDEKEEILGKKAYSPAGFILYYHQLDKKSQKYIKKLFELSMPYEKRL
jgi:hypothetical protein